MPLLFELTGMMLLTYGLGFALGWLVWGRQR